MPTGYTAGIEDGKITTGKDFLMLCARAFGACMEMRDEPLSVPIPESFEPAGCYKDWIEKAEGNLTALLSLTLGDVQDLMNEERQSRQKQRADAIERNKKIKQKYEAVRSEVERWKPPTVDHQPLKHFALEQIALSCDSWDEIGYWDEELRALEVTPEEWLQVRIVSERESLERYKKSWQEEVERTEKRNKWLSDLRTSLAKI